MSRNVPHVEEHVQPTDPNAILTRDEVARWLKVKPRQVERFGVPCLDLGRRTKRYLVKDVLEWLQAKRLEAGRPRQRRGDRDALSVPKPGPDVSS